MTKFENTVIFSLLALGGTLMQQTPEKFIIALTQHEWPQTNIFLRQSGSGTVSLLQPHILNIIYIYVYIYIILYVFCVCV